MKQYESVIIVNPVLSEDKIKKTIEKYRKALKGNGAKMVHEDNWGVRPLAYEIQGKSNGYYYTFEFTAEGDVIKKLDVEYRRDENILRFLTMSLDKHAVAFNEKSRNKGKAAKKAVEELAETEEVEA